MNGIPSWSGPITPEQAVREMLDAIATMSPGRYGWGIYEEKDAAAKVAANLEMGSGPCHLVWLADHPKTTIGENPERPEHAVVLCVTGNGPTSEKNAQGIIKILTVLRALAEAATTKGGGVMACKRCNRECFGNTCAQCIGERHLGIPNPDPRDAELASLRRAVEVLAEEVDSHRDYPSEDAMDTGDPENEAVNLIRMARCGTAMEATDADPHASAAVARARGTRSTT